MFSALQFTIYFLEPFHSFSSVVFIETHVAHRKEHETIYSFVNSKPFASRGCCKIEK